MRVLLIAFMIALLPVRAWLGDAMALSMAAPSALAAMGATAQETGVNEAAALLPCHGAADSGEVSMPAEQPDAHHAGAPLAGPGEVPLCHTLCDVCNGPAIAIATQPNSLFTELPQWSAPSPERFASHHVRRDVRPPIA